MLCKECGGEINLTVGRCTRCGRSMDDTVDMRTIHDFDALAERFGSSLSREDISDEAWEAMKKAEQEKRAKDKNTDARTTGRPTISLSTYLSLMGEELEEEEEDDQPPVGEYERPASRVIQTEKKHNKITAKLSGLFKSIKISADGQNVPPTDVVQDNDTPATSEDAAVQSDTEEKSSLMKVLEAIDRATLPVAERIRKWYRARVPELKRAQESSLWERLAIMGGILVLAIIVVVAASMISASIPDKIAGEWRISEENSNSVLTMDFSSGGEVTAYVYTNGEPHVYRRGTYDTEKKNGYNLLTIVYEDGDESRLYYEIDGDTGTFTNVDSSRSDTYKRIED